MNVTTLRARRGGDSGEVDLSFLTRDDTGAGRRGRRIRCPKCAWEPDRDSLWACECLYLWNTFDTGGRCPGCNKTWEQTQCLRCKAWSPHLDWYADSDDAPPA